MLPLPDPAPGSAGPAAAAGGLQSAAAGAGAVGAANAATEPAIIAVATMPPMVTYRLIRLLHHSNPNCHRDPRTHTVTECRWFTTSCDV
ncbi:hypothetical protein GCM10010472_32270 [Pseudonocardia halophobica]|uniref:Uncharacterized protein n=1 Tax=Pseudonocardia halophobica TaxID=29401 RepID=A0A9W6NXT4_9PSEU|nr:hypothetical protein GCM10017577_43570 [Pseudonocardia halophobica]